MDTKYASEKIIKINTPKKSEIYTIRFLIVCAVVLMLLFLNWFINPEHIGFSPIFWLLTFGLSFKLIKMIHEWYHYWDVSIPVRPETKREWKVDVLTTACPGEPRGMIIRTLRAMKNISYPHTDYLCDEGDDPVLKQICAELDVVHVTRKEKIDAKAGNINNALKQASGEICIVLDPDHEPIPEFIDRVIPYFEDEKIGYVQSVQAYGNQSESIIARGAAEQTYHFYGPMMMCMNSYGTVQAIGANYHFYGPMMMCMNSYGTVQAIGANCAFRRSALDSIGGHAAGLSEDMHTAMQLHAKGWKSIYIPEILTRGLVPATLSAYYKQQLKWSRGTFELLFRTYPGLFRNFTWRQKIHYLTIPLYFLFGLINLIDILIPALALGFAEVPWEVNISHFAAYFLPLCCMSMIIRLYAQRWLLEKHERGFHLAGGILRTATWWIFLIGFIYTIFKIKVPYIPTPKEDEHQNYWKLSLPNLIVCLTCAAIIFYGLSIDWSPYSFAMAFYALINVVILGLIVILSQQKMLDTLKNKIRTMPVISSVVAFSESVLASAENLIYGMFRLGPVVLIVCISVIFFGYTGLRHETIMSSSNQREIGGFFKGINISGKENFSNHPFFAQQGKVALTVFAIEQLIDTSGEVMPQKLLSEIKSSGSMPLINWQFSVDNKKQADNLFNKISLGEYNSYLAKVADLFRKHRDPVFISFCPGVDQYANDGSAYVKAYQYVHGFFNRRGISNLTWLWCPAKSNSPEFYPGKDYTDWIGFSCLNYAQTPQQKDWALFSQLYSPYRSSYMKFEKPVMITEFGSSSGASQSLWFADAFKSIRENFTEIKSVVFSSPKKEIVYLDEQGKDQIYTADFGFTDTATANSIVTELSKKPFNTNPFLSEEPAWVSKNESVSASKNIVGNPGNFKLLVDGKSFYIKGVAYNTAHDWRDGNMPLTKRQLEKDFERIKAMGANTIRRYDPGIYDKNILNTAKDYDLKVLYGFWFDPKIDYYKDSLKVKEYIADVEEKVYELKDHPSVLAWTLGNETWGLLKHKYSNPYLAEVREHYVKLIERLAQKIHEIDPDRPVFTCMEHHKNQIEGEIVAFRDGAPSLDGVGVNSYYKEQISKLNHIAWQFDSVRPYIITEFGPRGYWNLEYNKLVNGSLEEQSESEKSEWYRSQWENYIAGYKGFNLGGFAYCWHDRMEGSNTWFGLTDFKGRMKPSYYALREVWTGGKADVLPEVTIAAPKTFSVGQEYTYLAKGDFSQEDDLKFEWYLHKDEFLDRVKDVEVINKGRAVKIKIPEELSDYRLYLYVSDKEGKVTTASVPIKVKGK